MRLFEGALQKASRSKQFKIVVNCAGLSYIASAGLGAMMGAIEEIRSNGGDLRLASLNETVQNIFEILGFNHLYRIFPSEVEAIASFREAAAPGCGRPDATAPPARPRKPAARPLRGARARPRSSAWSAS